MIYVVLRNLKLRCNLNRVMIKNYLMLFVFAGAIIALDQWTKWLVRQHIEFGTQWLPESLSWLMPYARLVNWHNSGAAFGMFQNGNLIFTIFAFVVIGAILYYFPLVEAADWTLKIALGLQLAGASGNLIDRLSRGKVTDFISIGVFPVFNVADASISIGVVVLLLGVWFKERSDKLKANQQPKMDDDEQSSNNDKAVINSEQS